MATKVELENVRIYTICQASNLSDALLLYFVWLNKDQQILYITLQVSVKIIVFTDE
jgi:hypothetical protein